MSLAGTGKSHPGSTLHPYVSGEWQKGGLCSQYPRLPPRSHCGSPLLVGMGEGSSGRRLGNWSTQETPSAENPPVVPGTPGWRKAAWHLRPQSSRG